MASEQIFLDDRGVYVSNARMRYNEQTYAMSGITSVKSYEKKPSKSLPIILIIIGIIALSFAKVGIIIGLLLLAAGVAAWILMKPDYSVLLTSASGEVKAYTSKDKEFVIKIIGAVNDAIVHRG